MITSIRQKKRLTGHTGSVYSLERMQNIFFSGGGDGIVARWELSRSEIGDAYFRASNGVYAIKHLAELNKLFIGLGTGSVHIIDMVTGQEEHLLQLHDSHIFTIVFSAKYQLIITGGGDGIICVLDFSFALIKKINVSGSKVRSIIFTADGDSCIIGSGDGKISILEIPSFLLIKQWQAHEAGFGVNSVCLSPDGKFLLSGSRDARLNIYNATSLELMESIPAHNYAIYDIAFHSKGKIFATAGRDKVVKLWDADSFEVIERMDKENHDGHDHSVNKILWMDDDLVSAGDDRTIIVWETGI